MKLYINALHNALLVYSVLIYALPIVVKSVNLSIVGGLLLLVGDFATPFVVVSLLLMNSFMRS